MILLFFKENTLLFSVVYSKEKVHGKAFRKISRILLVTAPYNV